MKRKKVLFFGRKMIRSGGVESYMLNLASNINKQDISIDIIITAEKMDDLEYYEDIKKVFDNIYLIPSHKENLFKHIINVFRISKEYKNEVIHIHASDGFHAIDGIIAKLAGVKNVIQHSHNASFKKSLGKSISRFLFQISGSYYLGCTKEAGEYLFGDKIVNSRKFSVAKNGVDTDLFKFSKQKRDDIRDEFNIPEKAKLLGFVGRFSSEKNIDFVIEVFSKVLKYEPNTLLMLVGDGNEKKTIKNLAKTLNVQNQVIFTGERKDIDYIMSALDILLLPSEYEALGIVLVEGQTSGLQCIASTNVSKEAKISNHLMYLDLIVDDWVDKIVTSELLTNRTNSYKNTINSGYDSRESAKKMQDLYLKL